MEVAFTGYAVPSKVIDESGPEEANVRAAALDTSTVKELEPSSGSWYHAFCHQILVIARRSHSVVSAGAVKLNVKAIGPVSRKAIDMLVNAFGERYTATATGDFEL
jgi:hypothetical protein